jgi:PAS domain S-box-containing protein
MSRFKAYTADFGRELEEDENPMLTLCRTQKAFSNWKIGLVEPNTGKARNFDVSGKPIVDERTGEFLVGLVAFKYVTEYTEKLASQSEENKQQFQLICDTMPQMLWTTTADGYHDYFSQRWYDYTDLTRVQSLGTGWQLAFHPDDMPVTTNKLAHSLATGEEHTTEYRCRRADGGWR